MDKTENTMTMEAFNELLTLLGDVIFDSLKCRVYTDPDTNQRMIDIREIRYHINN